MWKSTSASGVLGQEPVITTPSSRRRRRWRGGRRDDSARTRQNFDFHTGCDICRRYVWILEGQRGRDPTCFCHTCGQRRIDCSRTCVRKEVQASQGHTCRIIVFANSKRLCDQLERSMPRLLHYGAPRCTATRTSISEHRRSKRLKSASARAHRDGRRGAGLGYQKTSALS